MSTWATSGCGGERRRRGAGLAADAQPLTLAGSRAYPTSRSLLPFLSLFSKAPSGSGAGESTGYSKTNSFVNPRGEAVFFSTVFKVFSVSFDVNSTEKPEPRALGVK